jgi:hypothetical protein
VLDVIDITRSQTRHAQRPPPVRRRCRCGKSPSGRASVTTNSIGEERVGYGRLHVTVLLSALAGITCVFFARLQLKAELEDASTADVCELNAALASRDRPRSEPSRRGLHNARWTRPAVCALAARLPIALGAHSR